MSDPNAPPPTSTQIPQTLIVIAGLSVAIMGMLMARTTFTDEYWSGPWRSQFVPPVERGLREWWGGWLHAYLSPRAFGFLMMVSGAGIAFRKAWAMNMAIALLFAASVLTVVPRLSDLIRDIFGLLRTGSMTTIVSESTDFLLTPLNMPVPATSPEY